jgi:hypothetical protein
MPTLSSTIQKILSNGVILRPLAPFQQNSTTELVTSRTEVRGTQGKRLAPELGKC